MFDFIKHISSVVNFFSLPKKQRSIVFYSEGKAYWVHLEGLLKYFLNISDMQVCYLSSGKDDPGLYFEHQNLKSFLIDEGWIRNWLFENIDTDIMLMTMPDLQQYQIKRSKHPVHYVYVQHSLNSMHMAYRKGAFDYFDTIFCSSPHHFTEIRALEKVYNLPEKNLVAHGYERLDAIIENRRPHLVNSPKQILVAPTWGDNALIETCGAKLISHLLQYGFKVTLRPHPQSLKFSMAIIDSIYQIHRDNKNFVLELDVASQDSLHNSDLMISDWSGVALDYTFGLGKPIIYIDLPCKKINNPDYADINIEPFEVWIRKEVGTVLSVDQVDNLNQHIDNILSLDSFNKDHLCKKHVFNLLQSSKIGANELANLYNTIQLSKGGSHNV